MRKVFAAMALFLSISPAHAAYLDLAWDANQEADLAGYRVYYGTESFNYINSVDVSDSTTYRLDQLLEEVPYYIAITAYDEVGNESDYSHEVSGVGVTENPPEEPPDDPIGGPEEPELYAGEELIISDAPTGTWYFASSYGRRRYAQTFRSIGSSIIGASVPLVRINSPTEPIQVSVRRSLSGRILALGEIYPSDVSSTNKYNPSWATAHFAAPAAVEEGSFYYLVIEVDRPSSENYYRVGYDRFNPYRDGMWYLNTWPRRDLDMACTITFW